MMVLCFLMSIPLKMMAFDKVEVVSQYKQGTDWKENPNFDFKTNDGIIYTCTLMMCLLAHSIFGSVLR